MDKANDTTESRILEAANRVFLRSGWDGARMQDIADEAGINKALLHYYFRNKEKLFDAVFERVFRLHFRPALQLLTEDRPLEAKIPDFVEAYVQTIMANPFIPAFVLHELNRSPQRMVTMADRVAPEIRPILVAQLQAGMASGRFRTMDPRQAVAHLFSMVIFPFIARPVLSVALALPATDYDAFLRERMHEIPRAFFALLRPDL